MHLFCELRSELIKVHFGQVLKLTFVSERSDHRDAVTIFKEASQHSSNPVFGLY